MSCFAWALPSLNEDGERVDVTSSLEEDKTNIVFFHAPWSKTSSRYKVELERWLPDHPEYKVLLVNVKSLKSPVAKQFKLEAVPAFQIYDEKGHLTKKGQAAQNEVVKILED
jgi:hypothetical protein